MFNIVRMSDKHGCPAPFYFVEMCGGPQAVNSDVTAHQLCHMLPVFIIHDKQNHRYFIWSQCKLMVNNISQAYD